jgi:hypothetical protein
MKKKIIFILFVSFVSINTLHAQTWDEWFRQRKTRIKYLLAQIAKLEVYLKLADKGNDIMQNGLTLISDIKNGDLNLHTVFFNHLKTVSPAVKNYSKVAAMLNMQIKILTDYKVYAKQFESSGVFSDKEIEYLNSVFTSLQNRVLEDADQLLILLTDAQLQMRDNDRLKRIDKLYTETSEQYEFLYGFGQRVQLQSQQRQRELKDLETLKKIYIP